MHCVDNPPHSLPSQQTDHLEVQARVKMMMVNSNLGKKRLSLIHARVDYMCEKSNFNNENAHELKLRDMCSYCEMQHELDISDTIDLRLEFYLKCSGLPWLCKARHDTMRRKTISFNSNELMTQKTYIKKIVSCLENLPALTAMFSIDDFHERICQEQIHMVKMSHVGEMVVYSTYTPYTVPNDILPLPPVGEEMVDHTVKSMYYDAVKVKMPYFRERRDVITDEHIYSWVQKCSCANSRIIFRSENCNICSTPYEKRTEVIKHKQESAESLKQEEEKMDDESDTSIEVESIQPNWEAFFQSWKEERENLFKTGMSARQKELNMIRAHALVNAKCQDLLSIIDTVTGIPDPCSHCQWLKTNYPTKEIHCTGSLQVCKFKFHFFMEWPLGLSKYCHLNNVIMKCSNRYEYSNLMDKLFSVKYIERAMQLKRLVDDDLVRLYPGLIPVINYYDCLLYRWYWPHSLHKVVDGVVEYDVSSEEEEEEEEDVEEEEDKEQTVEEIWV